MHEQLPFLSQLSEQFELTTGWQLSFDESKASNVVRTKSDPDSSIRGDLRISDMSAKLGAGRKAQNRAHCDDLVSTLDSMIALIQSDRERFRNLDQNLSPVVSAPFDWWSIEGSCGFSRNGFSTWSVTSQEQMRIFAGQLNLNDSFESALAASIVLSAFETTCESTMTLPEVAPLIPAVLQRSVLGQASLNWFSTVELDPITGEFEIDGFNSQNGLVLIDVHAATAMPLDNDDSNILYSGQILCVGLDQNRIGQINRILSQTEYSVDHCLKTVRKEFGDSASIFLYRK